MIGTVIGSYRVVRKLGKGGMGTVYLAEHTLIGRNAAIKVLLGDLSKREEIVNRFFNEARAATAVNDAGIVQVFDFGHHTDGAAYIVMEYLEGETLFARIRRTGRLAVGEAMRIARQIATSLGAAHGKKIVHRDLKPENVFMIADAEAASGERAKILDFGIAKLNDDQISKVKTTTGAIMGTPLYMSPEQCRGEGEVDHRADIYSLGCVLYCMITGRPPFDSSAVGEIIAMHLRETPTPPSAIARGVSHEVDELVLRCLAKDPDDRFQSMQEVASAIGTLVPGAATAVVMRTPPPAGSLQFAHTADSDPSESTAASPPPSLPESLRAPVPTTLQSSAGQVATRVPRSRAKAWIAAGVIGGTAGAATLYMALRGGSPPAPNDPPPATHVVVVIDAAPPPDAAMPPDAAPPAPPDAAPIHHKPRARVDAGAPQPPRDPLDLDGDGIPDIRR